ncbi:MAG: cobalamin synthesis protein P47K, partial [Candidatus Hydrogenedentes bacterium]|nr:cobalamin synthesis protein P47K [Candidatus Hydrogenedentota bacterium]
IAEPVGSCTDLSATIMQPLKDLFPAWRVAPLSVLIDPRRVHSALRTKHPRLHEDATYILKTQLREADQIVLTKADLLAAPEREELLAYLAGEFPGARPTHLSALTGEGVDTWLESVLEDTTGGLRITAVDYERYAQGEAVLGWLNAAADLRWIGGLQADWEEFAVSFFELLQRSFVAAATEVGHVKLLVACPGGRLLANLTSLEGPVKLQVEGGLDRLTARMTANARVQLPPQQLEQVFRGALRQAAYGRVAATMKAFHCLSPGRPVPTYRYGAVV